MTGPPPATTSRLPPMATVLSVVEVLISVILIFLVLLHSGKDAGLSGAFGIGGAAAPSEAARWWSGT